MLTGEYLGLPTLEWFLVPILGLVIGGLAGRAFLLVTWLCGLAFFLLRFVLEGAFTGGLPERIASVLIMWSLYALFIFLGAELRRRFG